MPWVIMRFSADDPKLRADRARRVVRALSVLVLLLPLAAMHGALFHGADRGADCAHPQDRGAPSICGDGVSIHNADLCGLCATSQRWLPSQDPVCSTARPNPLLNARLVSSGEAALLPPEGSPGPRAPPHSI